jgi:predicted RNase H-like HicB family nuclease
MHYELIIYWSKPDKSFVVEVPELLGCMTDGATYEEAVANVQTVIAEWIETARSLDRPIPEPRGKLPLMPRRGEPRFSHRDLSPAFRSHEHHRGKRTRHH